MEKILADAGVMALMSPFDLVAWAIRVFPKAVRIFFDLGLGLMLVFSCSIPLRMLILFLVVVGHD